MESVIRFNRVLFWRSYIERILVIFYEIFRLGHSLSLCIIAVQQAPVFLVTPDPTEVIEGQPMELMCHVKGKPLPKVTWYKNDKAVKQAGKTRLQNVEDKADLTVTSTISTKTVDVKRFDGTYVIEAVNPAGTARQEAMLSGKEKYSV